MSLLDIFRRPKFCPECGSAVVEKVVPDGFDRMTGEPKRRKRWRCSGEWSALYGHYDSDDERD